MFDYVLLYFTVKKSEKHFIRIRNVFEQQTIVLNHYIIITLFIKLAVFSEIKTDQ